MTVVDDCDIASAQVYVIATILGSRKWDYNERPEPFHDWLSDWTDDEDDTVQLHIEVVLPEDTDLHDAIETGRAVLTALPELNRDYVERFSVYPDRCEDPDSPAFRDWDLGYYDFEHSTGPDPESWTVTMELGRIMVGKPDTGGFRMRMWQVWKEGGQ